MGKSSHSLTMEDGSIEVIKGPIIIRLIAVSLMNEHFPHCVEVRWDESIHGFSGWSRYSMLVEKVQVLIDRTGHKFSKRTSADYKIVPK